MKKDFMLVTMAGRLIHSCGIPKSGGFALLILMRLHYDGLELTISKRIVEMSN